MKWEYNKVSSSCELTTSKLNELGKEFVGTCISDANRFS